MPKEKRHEFMPRQDKSARQVTLRSRCSISTQFGIFCEMQ